MLPDRPQDVPGSLADRQRRVRRQGDGDRVRSLQLVSCGNSQALDVLVGDEHVFSIPEPAFRPQAFDHRSEFRGPLARQRLRIGYVSPDLREHPVAFFLEPILACHDHQHVELFCYADVTQPDATTLRLQAYADVWRSLVGLSDARAAAVIRQDEIDILVDLAGHTGGNRLLTFARKPGAFKCRTWATWERPACRPWTTTSRTLTPTRPGLTDAHYQEQLIRLPECSFCYRPGQTPEVNPKLPAGQSGQFTFGCLNNLAKVSDEALAVWSRVLASVPNSRLLLRGGVGRGAEVRIRDFFDRHAIAAHRVHHAGPTATRFDYLELYLTVDIALDPFPYNGVTTTADALWMGVPVISLAGPVSASRQGVRFLRNAGMDELLAETPEQYVRIASDLAGDLCAWPPSARSYGNE